MANVMSANVRAAGPGDASNTTAPTQFVETRFETYAYRRFGVGTAPPLLFLQHFTGTLDNWDPAVTDPLARGREVILFESAGLGRSTGEAPDTIPAMAEHLLTFGETDRRVSACCLRSRFALLQMNPLLLQLPEPAIDLTRLVGCT